MASKAKTVAEYLAELPEDRRSTIRAVRQVILKNLGKGFEEGITYGTIGYFVPHSIYPAGYHCDPKQPLPYANLASQKNYMTLHLACIYGNSDIATWFKDEWTKTGKKLDMGKACIRFKKIEDLPLDLIGKIIARVSCKAYVAFYESAISTKASKPKKK